MCELDIDEVCSVWTETERTARKKHKCSCCKRTIEPKERYVVHFDVYDGHANGGKLCSDCTSDRAEFAKAHGGVTPSPEGLLETIQECIWDGDDEDEQWIPMQERMKASRQTTSLT